MMVWRLEKTDQGPQGLKISVGKKRGRRRRCSEKLGRKTKGLAVRVSLMKHS